MIRIDLSGCYTAKCGNLIVDRSQSRKGSAFFDLCRKLIANGRDPNAVVYVYRGENLCFEPRTLEIFAGYYVAESDSTSTHAKIKKWKPKLPAIKGGYSQSKGKEAICA